MAKEQKDLSVFKTKKSNREIHTQRGKARRDKLLVSIKKENLLRYQPILVNEEMEVIDGQNRLECARELGLSVWYDVIPSSKMSEDVIPLLAFNSNKWGKEDFLHHFAERGLPDYIALREFLKRTGITIRLASSLLGRMESSVNERHEVRPFLAGRYKHPKHREERIEWVIEKHRHFVQTIEPLIGKERLNSVTSIRFIRAFYLLFCIGRVDYDQFLDTVIKRLDCLHACVTIKGTLEMLINIYNKSLRNDSKIQSDEIIGV